MLMLNAMLMLVLMLVPIPVPNAHGYSQSAMYALLYNTHIQKIRKKNLKRAPSIMHVIHYNHTQSSILKSLTSSCHNGASSKKPRSNSSAKTGYVCQQVPVLVFLASRLARTCVRKASVHGSLVVRRSSHG